MSAFGNSEDGFKFQSSGDVINNNSAFPSLTINKNGNLGDYDFCLAAKVVENSNSSIELYPTNCNLLSGVICRQRVYVPLLCNSTEVKTDPMQLTLDPLMQEIKTKLFEPERDKMVEMFNRLNKTVAFEVLFRLIFPNIC